MSDLALLLLMAGLFWYTGRLLLRAEQPPTGPTPPVERGGPARLWSRLPPDD